MVDKEMDIRPIGYGAMLVEGVVGIVALVTASGSPSWRLLRDQHHT
jgi:carbon starvation protein